MVKTLGHEISPGQHYATCTSVTVLLVGDLLVVGHLGDSRVVLVQETEPGSGTFVGPARAIEADLTAPGEQLTFDHKRGALKMPHMPRPRCRCASEAGLGG